MSDCIFCKIIKGEIPIHHKIYEDDETLAFLDINPTTVGHSLVIPKEHFENIYATPDEVWCRIALTVKKVSLALKKALDADGISLSMNNEAAAGQVVFHDHMHVIPKYKNDTLGHGKHISYAEGEAAAIAEKIRKEIGEE